MLKNGNGEIEPFFKEEVLWGKEMQTELWSFDPGEARSINATVRPSELNPNFIELDLRWSDGRPAKFPILLTHPDVVNFMDLLQSAKSKW